MAFYKPKILSPVKKHPEDTSRNVFTYVHHTTVAPETTIPIKRRPLKINMVRPTEREINPKYSLRKTTFKWCLNYLGSWSLEENLQDDRYTAHFVANNPTQLQNATGNQFRCKIYFQFIYTNATTPNMTKGHHKCLNKSQGSQASGFTAVTRLWLTSRFRLGGSFCRILASHGLVCPTTVYRALSCSPIGCCCTQVTTINCFWKVNR
jgi:hypothetical protein